SLSIPLALTLISSFFFSSIPPPPTPTLFPYTTLFRSRKQGFEKMPLADKVEFFDVNETIKTADNWRELQARLGKIDLHIIAKGRGGALEDTRTGKTYKLSRVGREHSFGKLQRRF